MLLVLLLLDRVGDAAADAVAAVLAVEVGLDVVAEEVVIRRQASASAEAVK